MIEMEMSRVNEDIEYWSKRMNGLKKLEIKEVDLNRNQFSEWNQNNNKSVIELPEYFQ